MKKIFLLASLVFIFITSFGQQLPEGKTAEYYKHKAVKQNSLGWTLLGSGFGVMLISIPLYPKDYSFLFNSPETKKSNCCRSSYAYWICRNGNQCTILYCFRSKQKKKQGCNSRVKI